MLAKVLGNRNTAINMPAMVFHRRRTFYAEKYAIKIYKKEKMDHCNIVQELKSHIKTYRLLYFEKLDNVSLKY